MPNVQKLLQGMTLEPGFDVRQVQWHDGFGFMHTPEEAPAGYIRFVGFAAPYWPAPDGPRPVTNISSEVQPVTHFSDLPAALRDVDHQSKGVGTRFYNVPEAAISGRDTLDDYLGLFTLDLLAGQIYDRRKTQGGTARQIARHALQRAAEVVVGPERVVNAAHARYGMASAALLRVPPRARLAQRRQGLSDPEETTGAFMVLRNPNLRLLRVGHRALTGA